MISKLSIWAHANYGTTISANALSHELREHEIDSEVYEVLAAIENTHQFLTRS